MQILTIANRKHERFLRTKIAEFDFSAEGGSASGGKKTDKTRLNQIIKEIRQIMKAASGIGLSANQVGLNIRLFVVQIPISILRGSTSSRINNNIWEVEPRGGRTSDKSKFYAVFNPKIKKIKTPLLRNKKTEMEEGCLSVPGVYGMVKRYEKITLIGQDIGAKKIKIKAQGLLARVFQHEVDHLNGILFIDRCKEIYKIPASTVQLTGQR